jgi:hypothetical protein
MHLSDLIDDYFWQLTARLHSNQGEPIPAALVTMEYQCLLQFIARNNRQPIGINLQFGYQYLIVVLACLRMVVLPATCGHLVKRL